MTRQPDQLVVSISDIEMGTGGVLDDFVHTPFLGELIEAYAGPRFAGMKVELCFNGDTFDLLKTPVDGHYPTIVTEEVALKKIDAVIDNHPSFFDGVRRFLDKKGEQGHAWFIVGNHDQELVFPAVQARIRERIGSERISFPGFAIDFGDVRVEHGSQDDSIFRVDPDDLFVDTPQGRAMRLPWGTIALLDVAMPLHRYVYDLDRVKPRDRVFELLPDLRDFVVSAFWDYWTGRGREWLGGTDPLRQISWTMAREVAYRFRTQSAEIELADAHRERLRSDDGPRVITIGHHHRAGWWSHADSKLLSTGCFRDEFALDLHGNVRGQMPKVYAEIYLREGKAVRSHLVEVDGPPPPPGHAPSSVFDVLPRIRPLLASKTKREEINEAEAGQVESEAREAKTSPEES